MPNELIINGRGDIKTIYPPLPELQNTPAPEPLTFKDSMAWNKHFQQERAREVPFLQEYAIARREPEGTNRIYVVNLSDLHYGHADCDYDLMGKMIDVVEDTPNTYCILGWNILDAAIPSQFPDGVMWSGQTAMGQTYSFREKIREMASKDKILGAIGDCSCHEGWMKKRAGWMVYKTLFEGIEGVPLLLNGGYLDIQTGGETYRTALFHKTRYWSTLNKPHSGERAMDRIANAEIVFTSHMHRAATSASQRYNPPFTKDTAVVSSGTCKTHDKWLRGQVGEEGEPPGQGIILWADRHSFEPIYHFERGQELMVDALRNEEMRKIQALREELAKMK